MSVRSKMKSRSRLWEPLFRSQVTVLLFSLLISNCTLKKTAPEHPYRSESRVSKSFFESKNPQGRVFLKTFIAGWSPHASAGQYSSNVFVHYNYAEHTNLVFEIQEEKLVGKMIIPSFISKNQDCLERDSEAAKACRARWPNVVTFPIKNHFYYERTKDSRGRETDVYTENSNRSHWSARPEMNVDLRGISINDWAMDLLWPGHIVDGIEDQEWDLERGFLGFTLEARSKDYYANSQQQGKFRFNFLEFKHDPSFKITPYRHANAKFINILHVVGKEIDGDPTNPVLYAAHWDTRKKHTIYLHGFPEEYVRIAKDVIQEWNDVFQKVGRGRPFTAEVTDRKYAFDLRYPTITWVDDRRLSAAAPLGVGMALADVRNGDIRWGGVTIWGGMLQEYIDRSSPNATISGLIESFGENRKPIVQLGLMEPQQLTNGTRMAIPESLLNGASFESIRADLHAQFSQRKAYLEETIKIGAVPEVLQTAAAQHMAEGLANPQNLTPAEVTETLKANAQTILDQINLKRADTGRAIVDEMSSGWMNLIQRTNVMATQMGPIEKIYNADFIQRLIKMPKLSESTEYLPIDNPRDLARWNQESKRAMNPKEMADFIRNQGFDSKTGVASFCADRHMFEQIEGYSIGMAQANVDKVEAMHAVIKDLLLHEVGHMLGLGHNFKENILPEQGSLPEVSPKLGIYKPFSMSELEKQAKDQNKNYTTVMGYKDGAVDVIMKYDDLKPGPADLLSLEYLYNQRYPIYPTDATGKGDVDFVSLTADGWILENIQIKGRLYKPAYFPACNDFTASIGSDPYCARWDRGYNASTIVQNRFESYRGNLISQLTAFTDTVKGDAYSLHEYFLWDRSLKNFSRVRIFYDYMRQKYEPEIRSMLAFDSETSMQNLLQFSETCQLMSKNEKSQNEFLESLFKRKPELLDLCVASSIMVSELNQLMQLPGKDFTQIDYQNRFVSYARGGEGRSRLGRAFGAWKELARVPIKFTALMTLTSPYPYGQFGGWAVPITEYSREDGGYHISTLYAKEYTSAIASGTEMNLNLGNSALNESTSIGKTVMAMGYYLQNTWFSNDVLTTGSAFIQNIRDQTSFRYSYAMIDVEREIEEGKQIGRKFVGTIYNMHQRGPEKVPELYIYTNDRVILRPPLGSLILPVSPIRWNSKSSGYFYALKLDYTDEFFDRLKTNSVRRTLNETYQEVVNKCIEGENRNGLRFFFNKDVEEEVFPGFEFPDTIAEREDSKNRFLRSVESQFNRYYRDEANRFSPKPQQSSCEEAIRGQALIVMAASILNGYHFLDLNDYLEKDNTW